MRRWRLRLGAAVLLLAAMAGPGEASAASLTSVFTPNCGAEFASAGFAEAGADGRTRGFVEVNGDGCDPDERVWFVEGAGRSWLEPEVTPYRGVVLAAAGDARGTWVLFQGLSGVFLGRRTGPGAYTRPQALSTFTRPQAALPSGDLMVSGGRWWAVWSEHVGPAGMPAQAELFEAGTLARAPVAKRPVTSHPHGDIEPSVMFDPDRGALTLAWVRRAPGALVSELRVAHARPGEPWSSRVVSRPGTLNLNPTLALSGDRDGEGVTLAWQQDLRVVLSVQGADPEVVSSAAGVRPHLTVAEGEVRVGWTEPGTRGRAVVAEPGGDGWAERVLAPELRTDQTLVGLTGTREGVGNAMVLTKRGELYAASTRNRATD
jgi:hypothetical protein